MLHRCIDSIPDNSNIEIIVVDDNSIESQKPISWRKYMFVIRLDEKSSNGAGHARNMGLRKARGRWILFADADDQYSEAFLPIIRKYQDSDVDVVYFDYDQVKGDNITHHACPYIGANEDYDDFNLSFRFTVPWNKMVKREFINNNQILFEECPVGNDIFFTYQVGYFCKKKIVEPATLYIYYINNSSIIHRKKNNEKYYLTICKHIFQSNEFFIFISHPQYKRSILSKIVAICIKKGITQSLLCLKVFIKNYSEIKRDRYFFVNRFAKN